MITAFFEVLRDLWRFVFAQTRQGSSVVHRPDSPTSTKEQEPKRDENLFSGVVVPYQKKPGESFGRLAYVQTDSVACLSAPEVAFDTQIGTLKYGDKVSVTRIKDDFAQIETDALGGWVEKKYLSDDVNKVLPNFKPGYVYGAANEQTIKLRRLFQDELLGQQLKLPLQSVEYILYILRRSGTNVAWPPVRPREPGTWQSTLKGLKGVSMGVEPKTSSVFEYAGNGTPGFLGFVTAVRPDYSITLETVGRVEEGEYRVEDFTREEWKEWRPVFISFT